MIEERKEWFSEWFDSKYYHILYKNRDHSEARQFIETVASFLKVKPGMKALDAACGAGRHSLTLNSLGLDVLGIDLSSSSIAIATENVNETLRFSVEDMRAFSTEETFDFVFNLFTSLGYFEEKSDNFKILDNFRQCLKPDGRLVIDFMNAYKVKKELVHNEVKSVEGYEFEISRRVENGFIKKTICFTNDEGKKVEYEEAVFGFELDQFKRLLESSQFKIMHTFGDYFLKEFDPEISPRLILIAKPV